jgi:nitrogen fixation/metabolism regulation signal transduction histidine kinase
MTLRTRLFLAMFALALAPTLLFAWFTLVQLHAATERWYQSGVDHALESALETNRAALDRLERVALERAAAWALRFPELARHPAQREAVRSGLRDSGLEFAQVYVADSAGWDVAATIVPEGAQLSDAPHLGDALTEALAADHVLRTPSGVLAAVAPASESTVVVTGVRLAAGFWERTEEVIEARSFYSRLGVVVPVERQKVWLMVVALVLAIALGAVLLSQALAGGMTEPLSRLGKALEEVQDGAERQPLSESGPQELAKLATSFNAMTARLAEARAALQAAEREEAWRDVAQKLAHELKNLLTPMRLSLYRLQRRAEMVPERERAAVRDSINALIEEVGHIARLSDSFSLYARMPDPQPERLDLAQLARDCAALHEPEDATLRVATDAPLLVEVDRLLLSRALHNLLVNAFEASGPQGEVELVTGANGHEAWLEVRDRGHGLSPELEDRAFEPYVSTKRRGSGLGLSFARDAVHWHGGDITLTNRDGGGAVARLTLPLAPRSTDG